MDPRVGKIPRRREWHPAPVFLPGKSHGQRSLAGYSPWGRTESDTTEQGQRKKGKKREAAEEQGARRCSPDPLRPHPGLGGGGTRRPRLGGGGRPRPALGSALSRRRPSPSSRTHLCPRGPGTRRSRQLLPASQAFLGPKPTRGPVPGDYEPRARRQVLASRRLIPPGGGGSKLLIWVADGGA